MLDFPFIGRKIVLVHSTKPTMECKAKEFPPACSMHFPNVLPLVRYSYAVHMHAFVLGMNEWGLLLIISVDAGSGAGRVLAPLSNESNIICDFNEKNCTSIWKGGAVLSLMLGITAPLSVTL